MMQRAYSSRGELYRHILSSLAHLVVFEDGEVISIGSGFAFTADGAVLSAAHVVAGGFPVKPGEVEQANRIIVALFSGRPPTLYKPAICPFQIQFASGGVKPHQLDIAVLVPVEQPTEEVSYLSTNIHPPHLGEEMYFAGYSDEVEFPYSMDRHVLPTVKGMEVLQKQLATGIKERIAGPIVKRGTVGNIREARWMNDNKIVLTQSTFYLDNQIHSGASGGPVVCVDGTVRGIISKRTITKAGEVYVPAGSTLAIGLEPIHALPRVTA